VDGDPATRWGAAPNSHGGWLEVDLQHETKVARVVVMEIFGNTRTQAFAVECKAGDVWKPVVTGTTIAGSKILEFPSVSARFWRLNILTANEVPTIEEFRIFPSAEK